MKIVEALDKTKELSLANIIQPGGEAREIGDWLMTNIPTASLSPITREIVISSFGMGLMAGLLAGGREPNTPEQREALVAEAKDEREKLAARTAETCTDPNCVVHGNGNLADALREMGVEVMDLDMGPLPDEPIQ